MKQHAFGRTTLTGLLTCLIVFGIAGKAQAQHAMEKTPFGEKVFYYIPNLALDFLDIFWVGAAVGPGFGGEVAFTEDAAFGKYSTNEKGVGWFGSSGDRKLVTHRGQYETTVVGTDRKQSRIDADTRFLRGAKENKQWDVRGEAALGIVHPFFGIDMYEIGDFICGLVGHDLKGDDMQPRAYRDGDPSRKLGRGVCNVALGMWEVPKNVYMVKKGNGSVAGVTWGLFRGIQRGLVREVVGVREMLTFPTGTSAVVEPEFPFRPQVGETDWRVKDN